MNGLRRFLLFGMLTVCAKARGQGALVPPSFDAVQGAPFTLTVETRWDLVSETGPRQSSQRILRDKAGRQRYEARVVDGVPRSSTVNIYDVVAGKLIKLDPEAKTAEVRVMRVGRSELIDVSTATSTAPQTAAAGQRLLGTKEIAGLEAWGQRTAGPVLREDGSTVTQDRELWLSTHYGLPLMQVMRSEEGKVTQNVVRFDAGEPDASLFQIPAGFAVREAAPMAEGAPGTVRVGGDVSAPLLLSAADPEFSEEARRQKVSGTVLVHLVVDEHGMPEDVRVLRGVGHGLDEKSVEAVRQYRFKPAMRNGTPVKVEITVVVTFRIR